MVNPEFMQFASLFGISITALIVLFIVALWDGIWKIVAMWKASQKKSLAWFIILAIFNTAGILPILYIFLFSKIRLEEKPQEIPKKKQRKSRR